MGVLQGVFSIEDIEPSADLFTGDEHTIALMVQWYRRFKEGEIEYAEWKDGPCQSRSQ